MSAKLSSAFTCLMPMGEDAWGLKALEARINGEMVQAALLDAVEPLRQAAQAHLEVSDVGPYATGATPLAGVKVVAEPREDGVIVGLRKKGKAGRAFIGYWIEYGIPSRGIRARPWMRPAQDAELPHVTKRFCARLRDLLGFNR
jgi:hypothetical protein